MRNHLTEYREEVIEELCTLGGYIEADAHKIAEEKNTPISCMATNTVLALPSSPDRFWESMTAVFQAIWRNIGDQDTFLAKLLLRSIDYNGSKER